MDAREYVENKVAHMRRMGILAEVSRDTGAACPVWLKILRAEGKRHQGMPSLRRQLDLEAADTDS